MRFLVLIKGREGPTPRMPPPAMMAEIERLGGDAAKSGVKVDPGALTPSASSTRMRIGAGKLSITDGPFAEAKEVVGGYAFYECDTWEQARASTKAFMELHLKYWPEWEGECEIRQIMDAARADWQGGR